MEQKQKNRQNQTTHGRMESRLQRRRRERRQMRTEKERKRKQQQQDRKQAQTQGEGQDLLQHLLSITATADHDFLVDVVRKLLLRMDQSELEMGLHIFTDAMKCRSSSSAVVRSCGFQGSSSGKYSSVTIGHISIRQNQHQLHGQTKTRAVYPKYKTIHSPVSC